MMGCKNTSKTLYFSQLERWPGSDEMYSKKLLGSAAGEFYVLDNFTLLIIAIEI
jgi:hypothetical protein